MPVVAPAIAIALAAVGTGVATYSAVAQGEQQKEAANYNKKLAQNQALASQQQAAFEAQQVRRKNVLRAGAQRAIEGKSGSYGGSAEDVGYDTAIQGELEALSALYSGNVQSGYYQSRAKLSAYEGDQARKSGYIRAGGTLLSGAGQAVNQYANQPTFGS